MLINKYYVIVHGLKITSLFKKRHARGPRIQGGGEHVKIAYSFHAASTRRAKNTRLAWKRTQTDILTLLGRRILIYSGSQAIKTINFKRN